jgi:nickel superoxide dismutase
MRSSLLAISAAAAALVATSGVARAHCQIPCGIYNDPLRFTLMEEDVTTIEKAMNQINELGQQQPVDYNQIVRWVDNKDDHADKLSETVTYYFMAQRVKPADPNDKAASAKYIRELTLLHQIMIEAMKAKQTTDLEHCQNLRALIAKFKESYLGEEAAKTAAAEPHSHGSEPAHTH